jgi:hypothetical protein
MSPEERAYLSGIIDGEGSIMLIRFHHNQLPAPCVSIASTSYELLEWVRSKTGLGLIKSKKNYKPYVHENSFTFTAKYNDAIEMLEMVEPYLVINQKKLRAQLIINDYKKLTPRNGRYSPDSLESKNNFYKKFIAL